MTFEPAPPLGWAHDLIHDGGARWARLCPRPGQMTVDDYYALDPLSPWSVVGLARVRTGRLPEVPQTDDEAPDVELLGLQLSTGQLVRSVLRQTAWMYWPGRPADGARAREELRSLPVLRLASPAGAPARARLEPVRPVPPPHPDCGRCRAGLRGTTDPSTT